MVSGCTCGSAYKIGSGFDFVCYWQANGLNSAIAARCSEIGAYYGTHYTGGILANYTNAGGIINIDSSTSRIVKSSPLSGEGSDIAIEQCYFCEVTTTISGNGSLTVGGTAYGKYRKGGENVLITATAASGYKLKKMLVNGSVVQASQSGTSTPYTYTISAINNDASVVAYFVPASYSATCNTPSGGTVSVTVDGEAATFPLSNLQPDQVVTVTCTPNADKMVQNFVVDGYVTSGGSTGPQTFTFTIYEREDDAVYNCNVSFCDRTAIADSVVGKSDGVTDDATVTCDGSTVTRTNGAFLAYVGNTYIATAYEPTIFRTFGGWVNGNGELVSEAYSYGWTQGSQSVAITAAYVDKPLYVENFLIGTSTSDAGTTSGTAYVAGCRADITRPSGESKVVSGVTKYLAGTRTVSVHGSESSSAPLPANWTFSGVYVSDTNASGGTKFYKANGASSVTFANACDANIYAIFSNGETITPADSDQGHSSIATGAAATGMYEWEGGASNMTMRYHSKRFVASMPMAISAARVYADGYATGSTNDVKLKVFTFQSPETDDSSVTETTAKSQDAYRQPMRRPEKYIEVEVSAPHQVTQVAIATSMEALWQA